MTETLKAMSEPVRRKILDLLKGGELSAGDICAHFELSDATISHHLSVLKKAGLIDSVRKGTFIVYELNTSLFEGVVNWILSLQEKEDVT